MHEHRHSRTHTHALIHTQPSLSTSLSLSLSLSLSWLCLTLSHSLHRFPEGASSFCSLCLSLSFSPSPAPPRCPSLFLSGSSPQSRALTLSPALSPVLFFFPFPSLCVCLPSLTRTCPHSPTAHITFTGCHVHWLSRAIPAHCCGRKECMFPRLMFACIIFLHPQRKCMCNHAQNDFN